MTGCSISLSSHERVLVTCSPARCSPLSSSTGESGFRVGSSSAARIWASTASMRAGTPGCGTWAEHIGQDLLVQLPPPRQPGELHLDRGQRTDALRRQQQVQLPRGGGGLDRDPLPTQLEHRVGFGLRRFEIEERVGRARRGLGGAVPVIQRCDRQVGRGGRGRGTQDAAAESQVERAVHARPGREQRRIPARRVVPDPARSLALALGDPCRKVRGPDDAHPRALRGLIELRRDDSVGDRAEGDEHQPSICHSCGAARAVNAVDR